MKPHSPMRLPLVLAALLLAAGMATAGELPPLGLYQIDSDGSMAFAGNPAKLRIVTDGANGDQTAEYSVGDQTATRQSKGNAPVTHCVKSVTGGTLPPQANACKVQSTVKTKAGWVHTATCPFGKLTLRVRQLDTTHWEYINEVDMVTTGAAPDLSVLAPMLGRQAEVGATPQERAKARQQLAQLPQMQKQGDATYAATVARMKEGLRTTTDPEERAAIQASLAAMAPGVPTMKTRSRSVWTRIGDTCAGAR